MINYLEPGKTMTYTAPAGGVVTGGGYLIGAFFVVATNTVAAGAQFQGETEGAFTLPKATGEGALVEGQPLYWDVANARVTIDHSVGLPIGTVWTGGALTGDTTCAVRLHGLSLAGRLLTIRKRLTIAAINAGATLLPALPGIKYRLVDAFAIAVGGAVTSVTTVDLKGTQASSVVKLVAFGQAALTQSAMVRAGSAGGVILADGASFAQLDVNTAMTVAITGSNITVATNIDFEVNYALE
jgi:predicted RecA/RadA family phage recombinase